MTRVHTLKVFVDSKHNYFLGVDSVVVSFGTLKALYAVVKGCVGGIKLKVLQGSDPWRLPSTIILVVVAMEHVVSECFAEGVLVICTRLWLQVFSFFDD